MVARRLQAAAELWVERVELFRWSGAELRGAGRKPVCISIVQAVWRVYEWSGV